MKYCPECGERVYKTPTHVMHWCERHHAVEGVGLTDLAYPLCQIRCPAIERGDWAELLEIELKNAKEDRNVRENCRNVLAACRGLSFGTHKKHKENP